MKTFRQLIAFFLLAGLILPVFGSVPYAEAAHSLYCSNCGKSISSEYTYCPYCSHYINSYTTSPTYGTWSSWSTTPIYASSTRQVETRQVVAGYNMVHYGTQTASSPHYRMFRDYSIKGYFDYFGARYSYDEKHLTRYVSASAMAYAKTYAPGTLITGNYCGYQKGTSTAYNFGDDKYVWFIAGTVYTTEYRYRNIY